MQANFEIDKTAYPYGVVRIGDNHVLMQIPKQARVVQHPLPAPVARRMAVRLNALYHSGESIALTHIIGNPSVLVQNEARTALDAGEIDRSEYEQVLTEV